MTDRLAIIKHRHAKDQEVYTTLDEKTLEQMHDYYIHKDRGWLIDEVNELKKELIGNE